MTNERRNDWICGRKAHVNPSTSSVCMECTASSEIEESDIETELVESDDDDR